MAGSGYGARDGTVRAQGADIWRGRAGRDRLRRAWPAAAAAAGADAGLSAGGACGAAADRGGASGHRHAQLSGRGCRSGNHAAGAGANARHGHVSGPGARLCGGDRAGRLSAAAPRLRFRSGHGLVWRHARRAAGHAGVRRRGRRRHKGAVADPCHPGAGHRHRRATDPARGLGGRSVAGARRAAGGGWAGGNPADDRRGDPGLAGRAAHGHVRRLDPGADDPDRRAVAGRSDHAAPPGGDDPGRAAFHRHRGGGEIRRHNPARTASPCRCRSSPCAGAGRAESGDDRGHRGPGSGAGARGVSGLCARRAGGNGGDRHHCRRRSGLCRMPSPVAHDPGDRAGAGGCRLGAPAPARGGARCSSAPRSRPRGRRGCGNNPRRRRHCATAR